ncbi:SLAC1 family transporter, partial [Sandarakinorhabdus oryzae]|uniref:SLAC1 family transporter n=1 Tax=Sandarakinorhabdus oryzae TaxID=2675220 RepID=UPI0012E111B6
RPWLARVPMSLFASVMGMAGTGLAWRRAVASFGAPAWPGEAFMALAVLLYGLLLILHLARAARWPAGHLAEFRDPRSAPFVPAFSVATVLMAAAAAPYSLALARVIWPVAAGLHALFAFLLLRRWFSQNRPLTEAGPPWFIPIVGNLLMPVVGAPLGFETASWALFGIGAMFWLILAPIMTFRLFFADPLPHHSAPSLFILLAPPAVGSLAILALSGGTVSPVTHTLFGFGTMVAALMLSLLPRLIDGHFSTSWWALTFPSAAYASLAVAYAGQILSPALAVLGLAALALVTLLVILVALRSLSALVAGELLPND